VKEACILTEVDADDVVTVALHNLPESVLAIGELGEV